ncbi:hypothetical protein [Microbulbifer variabilis]|uniref:hypothetical protein n=1 Tax=Microbulbifer variabilis TaxID=266805 RepID=UPI00037F65DE|nr:hypothetical protein [Microbulbifer variabilis]
MKLKKFALFVALQSACVLATAGDIAYGTLDAVKVYVFEGEKVTRLIFSEDSKAQIEPSCNRIAKITHSLHGEDTEKLLSIALAGYMAGKKVRAHSYTEGSCEVGLLSLSETYM